MNKHIVKLLSEGNVLTPSELKKPNSKTKQPRYEILADAIESETELMMADKSTIVPDSQSPENQQAIEMLRSGDFSQIDQVKTIKAKDGKFYPINKMLKTPMFGGQAGTKKGEKTAQSGAGSDQTALQEDSAAVACAIAATKGGSITPEDITAQNIQQVLSKRARIASSIDDILSFLQNKQWMNTTIQTANLILGRFNNTTHSIFHRDTQYVNQILNFFKTANKNSGGYFSSKDKWNPADIWAVSANSPLPTLEEASDLQRLNQWMQQMFDNEELIGISLKKTGKQAVLDVMNYNYGAQQFVKKNIEQLITNSKNGLFSSQDTYIRFSESVDPFPALKDLLTEKKTKDMQFRSFGGNIQGEVKGKTASHGKIGHGPINKILNDLGLRTLTPMKNIVKALEANKAPEVLQKIVDMADTTLRNTGSSLNQDQIDDFSMIADNQTHQWIASKYQAVELLLIISEADKATQQDFITEVTNYAGSASKYACVYVKIH